MRSHSAESDLHLVGDEEPARFADATGRARQEAGRRNDLPAAPEERFADEGGRLPPDQAQGLRRTAHVGRILLTRIAALLARSPFIRPAAFRPVQPAVGIGHGDHPDMLRRAAAARTVELVRADVDQAGEVAVVGAVHHHETRAARVVSSEAQGQVVRFGSRVDEEANLERLRQERAEPPRVSHEVLVKVARVRVEAGDLLPRGPHHARVAVAHVGHVVHRVEIGAPLFIVEVLPEAAHDRERLAVREAQRRTDVALAERHDLVAHERRLPSRWNGRHAAGPAEKPARPIRIDGRKLPEQVKCRLAAHQEVFVPFVEVVEMSGPADTRAKPRGDEKEEDIDLLLLEGISLVIPGQDQRCGTERIFLAQSRVCRRDRRFGDESRMQRIAEIDDPLHIVLLDENIVVVAVVVDHTGPESAQHGKGFLIEEIEEPLDERPLRGIGKARQMAARGRGRSQIPRGGPAHGRVGESLQSGVDLPVEPAHVLQEQIRMRCLIDEKPSREV